MPAVPARAPQATPEGNPVAGLAFATQTAEVLRPRMKIANGRLIAPGGTPKDVERETMIRHFAAQGIDIRKMTPQQAATLEKEWYAYRAESPGTKEPSAYAGPDVPESSSAAGDSTPIDGGSFAAVKPKPTSTTTPGTIGSTGTDRVIAKSAGAVPYGVTTGDAAPRDVTKRGPGGEPEGPMSVPTRTLTGPFNDTSLPMGVRMQSWNDATTANSPNATGNVNKRNVINTGPGQTFNEGMKSTGAPMTAEGKLLNPGQDMAAGMTYTKPDGTVLTYTRPSAGKGGPAPLRLTGVTRPQNDRVNYSTDVETGAISVTTRNGEGGKTTHRYDGNSPNLAGLGNPTGKTVENADGSRQVYDPRTGNVVGTSSPVAGRPQNILVDRGADKPATQILANGKAGEVPRAQPVFTPQSPGTAPTAAFAGKRDSSFKRFQAGERNKDSVAKQNGGLIDGKPAGAVIASGNGGRDIKPVVEDAFANNSTRTQEFVASGGKPDASKTPAPRTVENKFWRKADRAMNPSYPTSPKPSRTTAQAVPGIKHDWKALMAA